ncbi:hypothetical protein [Methylosinus sp. Sm6]|uniref:hypothetical protein n=1 Tax=Methylosinus sp. Sm6 TaxID=2866948 RepID=UPI001C99411F|nr:hypothetical protein [Methylosinus sp. Sm6]MBY6243301.1 hypothetical protein [Methylosinus sp. Sm6]
MTTVVIDPRLRCCARRLPFARALARRDFRLATLLFCIAMTATLCSSADHARARRDGEIAAAMAKAHLLEEPHRKAMEQPDRRVAAPIGTAEQSKPADEDAARAEDAEHSRFEAKPGRARADRAIFHREAAAP